MRTDEGFGGRALQEGFGLTVDRPMQEVVGGGVANVEVNRRVKVRDCYKVWFAEIT